jgi:hypothetical protein
LFERHQAREIVLRGEDQLEPPPQDAGAFLGCPRAPSGQRGGSGIDGGARFGAAGLRDGPDHFAGCGIVDRNCRAIERGNPFARDVTGLAKEGVIRE